MGVKGAGEPPMSYDEVVKMVDDKMKIEQSKLYEKSTIFKINPPYNQHAKSHMAFAPFYPEMNKVGFNHKVHETQVVPDYRVYNVERTAFLNEDLAKHLEKLKEAGLKDPWTRNHIWRVDPHAGFQNPKQNFWRFMRPGLMIGGALALTHFLLKTGYEKIVPPAHPHTDKWWEERETPEPNEIHNRIKPVRYIYNFIQISRDPRLSRATREDYGVVEPPVRQWYKKENDPALQC